MAVSEKRKEELRKLSMTPRWHDDGIRVIALIFVIGAIISILLCFVTQYLSEFHSCQRGGHVNVESKY